MIVDSSALPEQVVSDLVVSAFLSAGQRCSATRVLFVQDVIADKLLEMLVGATQELTIGDPGSLATDIGPVIDEAALCRLESHVGAMATQVVHRSPAPDGGWFFGPAVIELDDLSALKGEVFGPVLHVVRWHGGRLDAVVDAINATGYGLTLGVHSRIGATMEYVRQRARVGNLYVNRSMVGAVVGVQPFGGEGLSGTGPKAGGPHYLQRFATERVVSVDTTSAGGNATLMAMPVDRAMR
jgi:RHH-type proline utilization regulon transcriptional repressor/proline dehydrogenase/delta 1-pyrroline-5-carboxylate dehydrogenase